MTARERLESYLDALRRRLLAHIYVRAVAVAAVATLLITCVTVWWLQREEFAPSITIVGRSALLVMLLVVAALLLWWPLRLLGRRRRAQTFERHLPDEHGRIQTYLDNVSREGQTGASPLLDLLAADAATIAERRSLDEIVSGRRIALTVAISALAAVALGLLLTMGPAHWGFGSRHLLLGAELPRTAVPLRSVRVTPGNVTVRRNSDLSIRASVEGFHPGQVSVFVRFADQQQWERAPMQPAEEGASRYDFRLFAVRGPLQYYVDAEGTKSSEHSVDVVDLPRIERVRLTYSYPQWTGLDDNVEETTRDIRAVAGTNVKVEVFADAPLNEPALIVDEKVARLAQEGHASSGNIEVRAPGHYQIGARVADEFVPLTDEYTIEVVKDEKPVIEIRKPARDWRATSIEEVPVHVQAEDDFRLRDVTLRYSVNGGDWQSVPLGSAARHTDNESLLRLEEIGRTKAANPEKRLLPGDLVSYYAVARDHKESVETDLFMVQVQPFERRFTQSQAAAGGGGGMGEEQGAISERQREILLATWNLQHNDERHERSRQQLKDSAKMLAELQATLAQQARTLAERTRARTSVEQDERVRTFVESLERAAEIMDPVTAHLSEFRLREAVPLEQQALQQLLRAESAFREVQVSMQRENAGGDGSQTARNFTEMFELEMDLEKNQYESESQVSMQNARKDVDDVLRKLKELAQRQEQLAQEPKSQQFEAEQRWKQEQLRREAEDLRRRLEQMNAQSGQNGKQQQRGEQGEQSSNGQSGDRQRDQVAQALDSVNKALQNMRSANGNGNGDTQEAAREASRNLRQALQRIDQQEPSRFDEELQGFADRAQRMASDQRRIEDELHDALAQDPRGSRAGPYGSIDQRRAQQLVQSKQQMAKDLTQLQGDMRNAVHDNRGKAPETTRRLSEIVRDVEGSDVMYRLNRSAAEIYYGRARDAAAREGLITDALDTLENELREAAALAANEKGRKPNTATPDALLAEVAALRRALDEARNQGAQAGDDSRESQRESRRDSAQEPQQDSQQGSRQASRQGGKNSERGGQELETNEIDLGAATSGARRRAGLSAWDPVSLSNSARDLERGAGSLSRQTEEIGQRIRELTSRMNRGDLTQAELQALRRNAAELRRLSGDPMAGRYDTMMKLVAQIELTALAASRRASEVKSAHTSTSSPDAPSYRDTVAEYYRRLGDK
jgi:hypothetical protein